MSSPPNPTQGFRNPIIPGFNPDPSIIRVGPDYFLATSTFEFFPSIPIYHSTNLVDWKRIGHVLTRASQLNLRTVESSGGVYAPCLRYRKGRFWVTVGAQYRRSFGLAERHIVEMQGFHVWTDNIWDETSWSDPIHHDVTGIDHDLFWDDDDTCYLSFSTARHSPSFHMRVHTVPIDLYTGDILSSPRLAMSADLSITANDICEGPHIFKKDGVYYLITANGGTEEGHSEWVYRSEEGPMGPWVPGPTGITNGTDSGESGESKGEKGQVVNPMIYNADHPEVQNTGHMDLVEGTDGRWWAVFLGVRPRWTDELGKDGRKAPQQSQLGRETLLAPVEWVDGWPIVNRRQPISVNPSAEIAHLADLERKEERYREEWSFGPDTNLALEGWYTLRTPLKPRLSLARRPGALALRGGPYGLEHDESISMLFQKQTSFEGIFKVSMEIEDAEMRSLSRGERAGSVRPEVHVLDRDRLAMQERPQEAGVVVWWSKWAHAALCVRTTFSVGDGEGRWVRELVLKRPKEDDVTFEEIVVPLDTNAKIDFRIETTRQGYTLIANTSEMELARHFIPVHLITRPSPRSSYFISTHLGVYAAGSDGVAARQWAYFDGASWEGVREGGACFAVQ